MFNLFGAIPDIFMGRDPMDALKGNALAVGSTLVGAPMFGGAGGAASGVMPASGGGSLLLPSSLASSSAQPGLLSQAAEFAKPVANIASAAGSVQGLLGSSDGPMQAPMPMTQTGSGSQTLTMLAGQNQQEIEKQMQMAEMERARRRQGFGGGLL